jgi:hypothetical protein
VPGQAVALDPGDAAGPWRWQVTAPAGATAAPLEALTDPQRPWLGGPPDDPATPAAVLVPDVAGAWTLILTTTCPVTAHLEVRPPHGINVELSWRSDAPVDLDLHLRHPRADAWGAAPYDCFSGNPRPDWGRPGTAMDDPILGGHHAPQGPEVIALAEPEDDADYRVGVQRAAGDAAVTATLRVYFGGVLRDELERRLEPADAFWDAATITWTPDRPRVAP